MLNLKLPLFPLQCLRRALRSINPDSQRPLHVSFDIDALDPLEAPSTGTPGKKDVSRSETWVNNLILRSQPIDVVSY